MQTHMRPSWSSNRHCTLSDGSPSRVEKRVSAPFCKRKTPEASVPIHSACPRSSTSCVTHTSARAHAARFAHRRETDAVEAGRGPSGSRATGGRRSFERPRTPTAAADPAGSARCDGRIASASARLERINAGRAQQRRDHRYDHDETGIAVSMHRSKPDPSSIIRALATVKAQLDSVGKENVTGRYEPLPDLDVLAQVVRADVGRVDRSHVIRRDT